MPEVKIRKPIRHRWNDLFRLVADVESYPAFVPHCHNVVLLSRKEESATRTVIISRMTVGLSALQVSYTSRTVADSAARRIDIEAIEGPLCRLRGAWVFSPRADDVTDIDFWAIYEFNNVLLSGLASRLFGALFGKIVDAFEQRADRFFKSSSASPNRTNRG
jgi:coenzyme Q-binding protein COQ10